VEFISRIYYLGVFRPSGGALGPDARKHSEGRGSLKKSSTKQEKAAVQFSGTFTIYYVMSKPKTVVITHDYSRSTVEPSVFILSKPVSDTLYKTVVVGI